VRRLVPLLLLAALAGCGGSGNVVSQTGSNVSKIKSGVLDLKLMVQPHGGGSPFGFELKGPFALRTGGEGLPVARIAYTQTANGQSSTATFLSNGKQAWIVSDAGTRKLTSTEARGVSFGGGFSGLDIGSWIKDAKTSPGPPGLERVTGTLDVVAAANGLRGVAGLSGRNVPEISGDDATRLRDATKSSSVVLLTTKNEHLLRRLVVTADLGFAVPSSLKQALGSDVGARVDFLLAITRPNSHVVVSGP
jgi:hypothetical protein